MGVLNRLQLARPTRLQSIMVPLISNKPHVSLVAQCRRTHERDQALVLGILQRIDQELINPTPQAIVFSPNGDVATQVMLHDTVIYFLLLVFIETIVYLTAIDSE